MPRFGPIGLKIACTMLATSLGVIAASAADTQIEARAQERFLTTSAGHRFVVPAGWTQDARSDIVVLQAPEKGSWVAFADVQAEDADNAVNLAFARYRPGVEPQLLSPPMPLANQNGWQELRGYRFKTSDGEPRQLTARAMRRGAFWSVRIDDLAIALAAKRSVELGRIRDGFYPAGYVRETFAGRTARKLDRARLKVLLNFVESARQKLDVPGIGIGIVQDGKTLFVGGFGVRARGKRAKVDADTLFPVASISKSLTSLLVAKLVDEGKLRWDNRVVELLPQFSLADATLAEEMQLKHLLCACAGLPFRNADWQFAPADTTALIAFDTLARMTPTAPLGSSYSYTNPTVTVLGLLAGHIAYPDFGPIEAYDKAMDSLVFRPLGMRRSTFDPRRAARGNFARTYGGTVAGELALVDLARDQQFHMIRPAGGAWSSARDLLAFVRMELAGGVLDNGKPYISAAALKARTEPQIRSGEHTWYGLGLETNSAFGTPMVFHGGRSYGFRGDTVWFPEHGVGMVILMNASTGNILMEALPRKALELLFDGEAVADSMIEAGAALNRDQFLVNRQSVHFPPDASHSAKLAAHYENPILGQLRVARSGSQTIFQFENWSAPVATRTGPGEEVRFVVAAAGPPFAFVVGAAASRRTLTLREGPAEFVFTEVD
jgi:CubicO group peptidase (beta-lactamase class C family)